jgi:hypothetical protein
VFAHLDAVLDLLLEEIGVVFVVYLDEGRGTLQTPAFPQRPFWLKSCFWGRSKFYLS